MKLLLTSAGITNKSIANALFELVGKKPEDTTIVFIPTASNVIYESKEWLIEDLVNLKKLNFKSIEITDISAVDESVWKPSLERADVLFFEGGNEYYLMEWLNKTGLSKDLKELLKDKVYVGSSAGSMVTCPKFLVKVTQDMYEECLEGEREMNCLNFVDFCFLPHLNSEYFPEKTKEEIEDITKDCKEKIYSLDDNSALKVVDGKVEVVSEGEWIVFN